MSMTEEFDMLLRTHPELIETMLEILKSLEQAPASLESMI